MKPLYWKLLLILGAVIVGASLIVPKALRKNALVDLDEVPHTELILEVDEEYLLQDLLESEGAKLREKFVQENIRSTVRYRNGALLIGFRSDAHYEKGAILLRNLPTRLDASGAKNLIVEKIKKRLYKIQITPEYFGNSKRDRGETIFQEITTRTQLLNADISKTETGTFRFRYDEGIDKKLTLLVEQIREPVTLSFHEVLPANSAVLERCVEYKTCPSGAKVLPRKNGGHYVMLKQRAIISKSDIKNTSASLNLFDNYSSVNVDYNAGGARKYCEFTAKHVTEQIAIVINDEIITTPVILEAICGGRGQISGGFTMKKAENLALRLNAGTLPTRMRVVEKRYVGSP